MIITDKNTGLFIHPNFDSGSYMGSFTLLHNELKNLDCQDPKWDVCSMLISTYVGSYLDGTMNELVSGRGDEYIPPQKGYQTDDDARSFIHNEGVGYAVTRYIDAEQFSNEKTRQLWHKAEKAILELEKHLGVE